MAQFPIKMLKDEQGQPFVPVVSASTITLMSGTSIETELGKKLEANNIIAGKNIQVAKDGNNCTISGPDIMNNLTTDASNKGVLDAYQGKVLNDKITTLSNTVNSNQTTNSQDIQDLKDRATALENGKVDKTKDAIVDTLGYTPLDSALKGVAGGVAELGSEGKVPASQLPSFVDDVLEYDTKNDFPTTGEKGKIYVATNTNLTYRWSGTTYIEISQSLALGETSSTAFAGDKGAEAYAHAVTNKGSAFASGLYKITTNGEGHVTDATLVQKQDIVDLGIPSTNTTYSNATITTDGLMSKEDKDKLDNLATVATSGSYNDLDDTPSIPTKVSELQNDKNYIITETDPTVPAWAKEATKPTYTANEVGALPSTTKIPTKTSDLTNDSDFITDTELATALNGKQDTLTAGDNITIENGIISATGSGDGNAVMLHHTWTSSDGTITSGDDMELGAKTWELYDSGVTPIITLSTNDTPQYINSTYHTNYDGTYVLYSVNVTSTYSTLSYRKMPNVSARSGMTNNSDQVVLAYTYLNFQKKNGEIYSCSIGYSYNSATFLSTNNKYSYTPTSDYNPATKKYVDDKFNAIPEPDLDSYATKNYVDTSINNLPHTGEQDTIVTTVTPEDNFNIAGNSYVAEIASSCILHIETNKPVTSMTFDAHYYFGDIMCYVMVDGQYVSDIMLDSDTHTQTITVPIANKSSFDLVADVAGIDSYNGNQLVISNIVCQGEDGGSGDSTPHFLSTNIQNGEFTPTENYDPATKKYVDDSIANAVPNLPDNLVSSVNNDGTDQVRIVVSETKPEEEEGYVDLWVNPKYPSYDSLVEKIEALEARIQELEDNQITFVQTGTM